MYWQVRHHQFVSFDDDQYIYNNNHIKTGLTWDNIVWAFTHDHARNYHPLTSISHMLDCTLYGLNDGGNHLTNLLFHIANVLLLFLVLKSMTANIWASAFVAALFALHPLHVESVAWASERKDVLSAFFGFLTMTVYYRYARNPGFRFYLLAVMLFALGLLAKPMLVTLPILLLLLDYWPLGRVTDNSRLAGGGWKWLIIEKIPFFALAAIIGVITFSIQKSAGFVQDFYENPLVLRMENAVTSYIIYIIKMFWPVNLAIFYPHPGSTLSFLQTGPAFFVLLCITILALRQVRRRPWFAVGWFWYLISMLPVIGLVQVGLQSRADRYTYMSYTGLFLIVAWGADEMFARLRYKKIILATMAGASISILAVLTLLQAAHWQNSETLYTHATKVVKGNWWAHQNLGLEFVKQGKLDQAIKHLSEALRINPESEFVKNDLAAALFKQGDIEQAIKLYQEFLPPLPENINLIPITDNELFRNRRFVKTMRFFSEGHANLGLALMQRGEYDKAVNHFLAAIQFKPELVPVVVDAADSLFRRGRVEEAEKLYQQIRKLLPEDSDVRNRFGVALEKNDPNIESATNAPILP
ncbi:MAG: tetratricopeptide repeat protein [Sedimentisphaerales bacterium]|nr:tetratricopeptide repeat protein [Sedimentisphaerales bacterium]